MQGMFFKITKTLKNFFIPYNTKVETSTVAQLASTEHCPQFLGSALPLCTLMFISA